MNLSFCTTGGIMALLTVVTTLGIHSFLGGPATFEEALQVYKSPYYLFTKFWVVVHCIAVMVSMYAFCKYVKHHGNVFAGLGFTFYAGFGLAEILRMCLVLGYLGHLRSVYLVSDEENVRHILRIQMDSFTGFGQGLFLTFFICFIMGNLITGLSCLRMSRLFHLVGIILIIWAWIGLVFFANEFFHIQSVEIFASYFNAIYQPFARALIALALFRAAGISFRPSAA